MLKKKYFYPVMVEIDFLSICKQAWVEYDATRPIKKVTDISAKVSTNHVYKIDLMDKSFVIAKLSYFGKYDDFVEDHTIVNILGNNLPYPFDNVLSRSLMKGSDIFIYRHLTSEIDAAVVFYRPVSIKKRPPKRLSEEEIVKLGKEMAKFHKSCYSIRHTLPVGSKSLKRDISLIKSYVQTEKDNWLSEKHKLLILDQCSAYLNSVAKFKFSKKERIPVFIDWNIGNFSVTSSFRLYSRWDYDWFRTSSRVLDFYFLSRVVSDLGDRTLFTYNVHTLGEPRFKTFLKAYHEIFPLSKDEVLMIKEAYRFFILNYVIRHGDYFFNEHHAYKLKKEALDIHLPAIDEFDAMELVEFLEL